MKIRKSTRRAVAMLLPSLFLTTGIAMAQDAPSACVEQGALAFDNWTKTDAGGTGNLPAGETNGDYVRCKACHGWDRAGTDGGYVRRSRTATRPNAGDGDGDSTTRAIVTGTVTSDQVLHTGTGRSYEQGSGSWVALDATPTADNTAAHANGFTLGNQHPDFSTGPLTQDQVDCLVEFLNFEDGDPSNYFSAINPALNPVLYTPVGTADAVAGEAFFNNTCVGCHTFEWTSDYVHGDGKYSELAHKVRWGVPDEIMTRAAMGDPTAQDVADLVAYLQTATMTGFMVNPGLTGTWGNLSKNGEGFLLEVGYVGAEKFLYASFYTYGPDGEQTWLVAAITSENGTTANVTVYQPAGGTWGDPSGAVTNIVWGTGTFTFPTCTEGSFTFTPNQTMLDMGYTEVSYSLARSLESGTACPTFVNNEMAAMTR